MAKPRVKIKKNERKPNKKSINKKNFDEDTLSNFDDEFCVIGTDTYKNSKPGEKRTKCCCCGYRAHRACTKDELNFVFKECDFS